MKLGAELHDEAVRLQLEHAEHARQAGDKVTERKALERAERARELARVAHERERRAT